MEMMSRSDLFTELIIELTNGQKKSKNALNEKIINFVKIYDNIAHPLKNMPSSFNCECNIASLYTKLVPYQSMTRICRKCPPLDVSLLQPVLKKPEDIISLEKHVVRSIELYENHSTNGHTSKIVVNNIVGIDLFFSERRRQINVAIELDKIPCEIILQEKQYKLNFIINMYPSDATNHYTVLEKHEHENKFNEIDDLNRKMIQNIKKKTLFPQILVFSLKK